ncbi:MAG: geranylgeranyl reductase family protein [Candidatus Thorarchaeota archaeon]
MVGSFDVAVVGAGPAGSTSARVASESGLKTLVFDRRNTIGIPVQCGELIPTPAEAANLFPSSKRMPKAVNVSKKFVTNRTTLIRLVSPNGTAFEFPFEANIVDRSVFDQHLAHQAEDAGAELLQGTRLVSRSGKNELVLKSKNTEAIANAKVVIGADGAHSIVAQSLGENFIHRDGDLSPSLQFVMENSSFDPSIVEMHFGGSVAPGGYAWIIPKGEGNVNVGFGMRHELATGDTPLRTYLERFAFRNPNVAPMLKNAKILSTIGAIIPVGGPLQRTWSPNTMLVGDAAGHVMASNGGGIPTALCGGLIAGDTVSTHFDSGLPLSDYESTWKREFGRELDTALRVLRVADKVMPSDSITDICMQLAGVRFLEPLIRCRLPPLVDFVSKTLVRVLSQVI